MWGVYEGESLGKRLGAGGAAAWQNGERRVHLDYAGEGGLGDTREMFGEDSVIEKFYGVIGPTDLQDPALFFSRGQCDGGSDFGGGNLKKRVQVRVEDPDMPCADEKLDGCGRAVGGVIFTAAHDNESAQLSGFFVGIGARFGWGQEDGGEKHRKSGDCGEPTVPETERQDDECRACETEENAEGHPGLSVMTDAEKLGNQKHGGKDRSNEQVA